MKLPANFFNFDIKDSLRLAVWIVMAAFALGGLYAQRKSDMELISSEYKALRARVEGAERTQRDLQSSHPAILVGIQSVQTELRYVNEKIDVLRADIRVSRSRE